MKVLRKDHRYELENFEPNKPSNEVASNPIVNEAYNLCLAIEECGASDKLTEASTKAGALLSKLGDIFNGNQTLQFIEKAPCTPGDSTLYTVNNGTTNEEVLAVLIDRLNGLQAKFPCRENAIAITKLDEALLWLNKRTNDRKARGVEGKQIK